jgi:hypothetical protein
MLAIGHAFGQRARSRHRFRSPLFTTGVQLFVE